MRALLFLAAAVGVLGGRLTVVTQDAYNLGKIWQWALDPATGETQEGTGRVELPGGDWQLVNGTHGQSSAVFYMNSSLFVVAENSTGDVALFQLFTGGNYIRNYDLTSIAKPAGGAKGLHVDWDGYCNVIVTALSDGAVKQYEISEYDGQVRPLADQTLAPGWEQKKGFFAIRYPSPYTGRRGVVLEGKCDDCTTYALEAPEGVTTKQPNIVGRWLQNGSVAFNMSDDNNARLHTMTYASYRYRPDTKGSDIFMGLGECCDLRGCPYQCEGHGGELSLVLYKGGDMWPQVVATLNGSSAEDSAALRLGVAVDLSFPINATTSGTRVSVMSGGRIMTYRIDDFSAVLMSQSPQLSFPYGQEPLMWAYTNS